MMMECPSWSRNAIHSATPLYSDASIAVAGRTQKLIYFAFFIIVLLLFQYKIALRPLMN